MNPQFDAAAKRIRLLILDVDGILTDGQLYYSTSTHSLKAFNIQDGLGIQLLQRAGIKVAVISGKASRGVAMRLTELGVQHQYLGHDNKRPCYEELKQLYKLEDLDIAYMGDDLPDLALLKRVGLPITVPNASTTVKQHVSFVTTQRGGQGAVREVCEFILHAQNHWETLINTYLD